MTNKGLQKSFFLQTRLRWVLWWRLIFLGVMAGTAFVLGNFDLQFDASHLYKIIALGIGVTAFSFSFVGFKYDRRQKSQKSLALFQIAVDCVLTSLFIAHTGGLYSAFILFYGLNIIVAGVLLLTQGAVFATVSSIAAFVLTALWQMPWAQWDSNSVLRLFFVILALSIVGYLVRLLMKNRDELIESLEQASENLKDLETLQAALVDHIPSGTLLVSQEGKVLYSNASALRMIPELQEKPYLKDLHFEWSAHKSLWEVKGLKDQPKKSFRCQQIAVRENQLLLVFDDLTHIRQMEENLRRQDKLASIGQLAAGLAHEIKNPLASLSGSIQVLKSADSDADSANRLMSIILRETDRLDHLVQSFLDYAKPSRLQINELRIQKVFEEILELMKNELAQKQAHKKISFDIDCEPQLSIECDSRQIRQVFWNLLGNAVSSIESKGHIAIRAGAVGAKRVRIEIEDTGCGISPEMKEKIFEPFFTGRSEGTGLGLALVFQILQAHGAEIGVESVPQKGSLFWIEFLEKQPKRVLDDSEVAA